MSKIMKATISLMIATAFAKILGFARELVLASSYGATMYSDAYITASNIPIVIFTIIGGTLSTVLIPTYFDISGEKGENLALKYINNVFNLVIISCIIISVLGVIFTEDLVKVFAMGFEGESFKVTVSFTRVIIIGIVATGLSYIMTAYLQIKNNFTIPGLISIPKNIIIIASIILSIKYNPYIMVWGTLIGMSTEFLFQLPYAIKQGYRYEPYVNIKDKYIKNTIILICPVLIGVAVNQVNTMVDRTLASTLVEGSVSALNYANKLNTFVMGLFILSVSAVMYPTLSKLSINKNSPKEDFVKFTDTIVSSINSVILLVMPISIGAIVLSTPIVKILFERGEFDSRATTMTAIALIMYSVGMVACGINDLLTKIFYSLHDTKTPMIIGVITVVLNIVLNLILIRYLKLAGLALGTSLAFIVNAILLFCLLRKKIGNFSQDKILKTGAKSMISSIIMGIITSFSYKIFYSSLGISMIDEIIALSGAVIVGVVSYGILIILFKVEEIEILKNILRSKVKNRVLREK